ncbi:MAG: site-2 protease family protein [Phycisphaerales bacterium]
MFDLPGPLGTFANFLVIAAGFGFIIFIHELGHFLAAKWAGIRVLAFSIGFGQIVWSFRKGIGLRRGSSEPEYIKQAYGLKGEDLANLHERISPTEYRLSMLPLGGYVKMLGQEDLNPEAVSGEPDSYQNCSVPKRMVVITAGVVMNVISAAVLFIIVFMVGLRVFPAQVGYVAPDSPAAMATAAKPGIAGDIEGGIKRGDRITRVNDRKMYSFEHIMPEIAMSRRGQPVPVVVQRPGVEEPIEFVVMPEKSDFTGLLDIGIDPPISPVLKEPAAERERRQFAMFARELGLGMLEPGDRFVSAAGQPVGSPFDILDLAEQSGGEPIPAQISRADQTVDLTLNPVPEMQTALTRQGEVEMAVRHVLGLSGVMMVQPTALPEDTQQGLMPGDIFARIGTHDYPSTAEGISLIRAASGRALDLVVLRTVEDGGQERVKLTVQVSAEGTVGFYPATTTGLTNLVSAPRSLIDLDALQADPEAPFKPTPAQSLIDYPGSRIIAIGGTPIRTLRDLPKAIAEATEAAFDRGEESFSIPVTLELPLPVQPDGSIPTVDTEWELTRADIETVRGLGWTIADADSFVMLFEYDQIVDKSDGPLSAISRGIAESRRVMMQTYLTFLRLFEGSVNVTHLKGPVGIAHLGTQIASQGFIWVLFFMALISINLAVINFLPLPIVDGGQFLMLAYEWVRGRPVPIVVQNVATMAGLLLIGAVFLLVTFNDVKAIFGV